MCGLYDLKPSVVALNLPTSSTITFSSNYGGETNIYEGFEASVNARPKPGTFLQAGINAPEAHLRPVQPGGRAGILGYVGGANTAAINATEVAEMFPDGSRACHQDLPYRPDLKLLGSYTLPLDIQFSATFQFTRGVQTGGAAPSVLATWTATPAIGDDARPRLLGRRDDQDR